MRKIMFCILALVGLMLIQPNLVQAQSAASTDAPLVDTLISTDSAEASDSAIATGSAIASPSAQVEQRIQEKKAQDITEPTGEQKSKLVAFLENTPMGPLSWYNFIQYAIRQAVSEGVTPNIIVLVLLFPLVASLIGASRHIIGLRGFGIYIPAVLSVAFVSTGIVEGILIFLAIVGTALVTKNLVKRMKISYLPRTALLLWTISLGIFATLLVAPIFNLVTLMSVNIFPILILVLLSENFLDAQGRTKQSEAIALTVETIGLAFICGLILKWELMQRFALTQPELLIIGTAAFNLLIGKFTGLRITEWLRFRSIIEEE